MNDKHKLFKICLLLIMVFLVTIGVALFGVSYLPFESVKVKIDSYALYGSADNFTPALFKWIVLKLRIIAIVMFIAGGLLYIRRQQAGQYVSNILTSLISFLNELAQHFKEAVKKEDKIHLYAFFIILLAAIAVRLFFLSVKPMSGDEAATFYAYASKPLYIGLSNYSAPNNHLFHTFFVHISYLLFGNPTWAIRLPAFLAGILLMPASYVVIRIFYNKHAALLTAGIAAASGGLIGYSTSARGYTLICLIFLVILALAAYLRQSRNPAAWLLFAIFSALGFYTIPIMLYPFGTVVIWLFLSIVFEKTNISRSHLLKDLFISLIITALFTFILYVPVIAVSGIESVVANKWVTSRSWSYFITELPSSLGSLWNHWNIHIPSAVSFLLVIGFFISLVFHKRLSVHRVPIVLAAAIWCIPILIVQRVIPYNRVWLFLLPLYIGLASAGVIFLLSRIKLKKSNYTTVIYSILAITLSVWLSLNLLKPPYYSGKVTDNEPITVFLKDYLKPGDRVLDFAGNDDPDPSMIYYFKLHDVSVEYLTLDLNNSKRILIINNDKTYKLKELMDKAVMSNINRTVLRLDKEYLNKDQMYKLKKLVDKTRISDTDYTVPKLIQQYKVVSLYEVTRLNEGSSK